MKALAYLAAAFFLLAWIGNTVNRDLAGALECVGLAWLSLWAANKFE